MARMRFGIFLAPFHCPTGQRPTVAYERDLETILQKSERWAQRHWDEPNTMQADAQAWTEKHAAERAAKQASS